MTTIIPVQGVWWSLVGHIVGGGKRWRHSEWTASVAERPEQVIVEAFPIIAWNFKDRGGNAKSIYDVEPLHDHPRAGLADLREMPGGSIRLRNGTVLPNRAALVKTLLGECQKAWDAAHPITDAPPPTDATPDSPTDGQ